MKDICKFLLDHYQVSGASPGKKVECPFCHHTTLSIHSNNTFAKCFHPECETTISGMGGGYAYEHNYYEILESLYKDWRAYFLSLEHNQGGNAYHYVVDERKIHPDVVRTDLGAIPQDYDESKIDGLFQPLITEIEGLIDNKDESKNWNHSEYLNFVKGARDKLKNVVVPENKVNVGYLSFFYRDDFYRITAIKFRIPYTKTLFTWKPRKRMGVFGLGLFPEVVIGSWDIKKPGDKVCLPEYEFLAVVEGEFNALQLQSLLRRNNQEYQHLVAIGGVTTADLETIRELTRIPVIIYDNDEAGLKLMDDARQYFTLGAITTPEPHKDLDEYIRSFGENHEEAFEKVNTLLSQVKKYPKDFSAIKEEINKIRKQKALDHEINQKVSDYILEDLMDRGELLNDGFTAYLFLDTEKKLISMVDNELEFRLLMSRYSLNEVERIYKFTQNHLINQALEQGKETEIHRFAYYDKETKTLYIYNHPHQMFRISDEIELVDNGTDGVLFIHDPNCEPFQKVKYEGSPLTELLIDRINFAEDILTVRERQDLFLFWMLSLFFESVIPTKAIMAFIGQIGSGKTYNLKMVLKLFFGPKFDVTDAAEATDRDFDAAVCSNYFLVIDNADTKNKWLENKLAIMATGGTMDRREYFTTNKLVKFTPKCFLGITSHNPQFRRKDVADRVLLMKVKRLNPILPENTLTSEILSRRNEIMSEILGLLRDCVMKLREKGSFESLAFRMADFSDFVMKVAQKVGDPEEMKAIFIKLGMEQSKFALEEDPLFELLKIWVLENPESAGKGITNNDLCDRLTYVYDRIHETEKSSQSKFKFKGEYRKFGVWLKNMRKNLEAYFDMEKDESSQIKGIYKWKWVWKGIENGDEE